VEDNYLIKLVTLKNFHKVKQDQFLNKLCMLLIIDIM